jgi:hypothetical protein
VLGALISALTVNSSPKYYANAHMGGQSSLCLQYSPGTVIRMPLPRTSKSHFDDEMARLFSRIECSVFKIGAKAPGLGRESYFRYGRQHGNNPSVNRDRLSKYRDLATSFHLTSYAAEMRLSYTILSRRTCFQKLTN